MAHACIAASACVPIAGGLIHAQTVSIALCQVRNLSNEPQVFLTIMDRGGNYADIAGRVGSCRVAGIVAGESGKRLGSRSDRYICGVAELAGKFAGCHRRTDSRPGRRGLYADVWHRRQRRGGCAATCSRSGRTAHCSITSPRSTPRQVRRRSRASRFLGSPIRHLQRPC